MGLEKTFYPVLKGVGVVKVCAIVYRPNITCPITFPFNISFSASNDIAGIFSRG